MLKGLADGFRRSGRRPECTDIVFYLNIVNTNKKSLCDMASEAA